MSQGQNNFSKSVVYEIKSYIATFGPFNNGTKWLSFFLQFMKADKLQWRAVVYHSPTFRCVLKQKLYMVFHKYQLNQVRDVWARLFNEPMFPGLLN